jgi:hypothetical protein
VKFLASIVFMLGLLTASPAILAHGDEDHGDKPHPVATSLAPRFEARSDLFELVGVLHGEQLVITLDRADDNAPITVAEIEIETEGFKGTLTPGSAGDFRIKAPALAKSGKFPLTLTVTAGDEVDLLTANFEWAAPVAPATPPSTFAGKPGWIIGLMGLVGLLIAAGFALRRRKGKHV